MKKRNIIFGIDGVPFKLMDDLSDRDIMPNFKELKNKFTFTELKSSIPSISSVSWSSIITGKNPGEHGIFGFTQMIKGTYSISYPNFNSLKSNPFWINQPDKKHVIFNVPSTYPAKKLNGIHIAGFVALDLEKAVYPRDLIKILKDFDYEIDVDSKLAHQQSKDAFLNELFRILSIRRKTYQYLWSNLNWDNFIFIITGSDRIGHFLWDVYEDKNKKYHNKFLNFFHEIDDIIGELFYKLNENDTFIILSDHGMERKIQNVNLNTYLEYEGYLNLSEKLKRYNRITKSTKAFVLDPGRVYLNRDKSYPNGSVEEDKEKELMIDLKEIFYDLKFKNQKVIKNIYEKEEIYSGKMLNYAPDIVLIENPGFRLKGTIGKKVLFDTDHLTGKHNDNAFLFINKEIKIKNPKVEDVIYLIGEN